MPNEPRVQVDWYANDVLLAIEEATHEALLAMGFDVEGQAKINVQQNGQIDTGFMVNSVYTTDGSESGYRAASAAAHAKNPEGEMAPEADAGEGVAVAVGASYAVYQEMKNSFLYRGLEQVAGGRAEAAIEQVARRRGLIDG